MNKQEAFKKIIDENVNLIKNEESSKRAGYDIYDMFETGVEGRIGWVSDLGDRLEVNTLDGTTDNIWFKSDAFDDDTFSFLLANWLKCYTEEVINKVLAKVDLIRKNETTMKLLFRLVKEVANDDTCLQTSIKRSVFNGLAYPVAHNCLSRTESIRDTLYILWIEN